MAVFEIGDSVEALDDLTVGKVVKVSRGSITIESKEGFLLDFGPDELIKISSSESLKFGHMEVDKIKAEKDAPKRNKNLRNKTKERNAPKMEVDLHIHQLAPSTRGMTKHEMLNLQIDSAKRQLEFAIRKRIQKVVFIHGVGEGVLKEELYYLFRRYENVKYYDADYQKYGLGATEVYIMQNP